MLSTVTGYQMIARDMTQSLERTARKPDVSRDTQYYLENIGNITSIDEFIGDYKIFSYAMKAFGLSDMVYAKAFIRKVLTEGVRSDDAFANKLVDQRYRELARAFNFEQLGDKATNTNAANVGTAQRYIRQKLEEDAGADNEGIRLALYFERKASTITNAYQLLADPALLKVAQTALGVSTLTGSADVDKQANMFAKRIDFTDFQEPEKLRRFVQRFTAMWEIENPSTTAASVPSIMIGGNTQFSLSAESLMSLQNLKFGR